MLDEEPGREVRVWQTWVEGRELVVFDPHDGPSRSRWQVFRRDDAGDLVRVVRSDDDRVPSEVLGCHLRWLAESDEGPQLRLGVGAHGERLVPTPVEQARAETEQARAEIEQERARRIAIEAELAALREALEARSRGDAAAGGTGGQSDDGAD